MLPISVFQRATYICLSTCYLYLSFNVLLISVFSTCYLYLSFNVLPISVFQRATYICLFNVLLISDFSTCYLYLSFNGLPISVFQRATYICLFCCTSLSKLFLSFTLTAFSEACFAFSLSLLFCNLFFYPYLEINSLLDCVKCSYL